MPRPLETACEVTWKRVGTGVADGSIAAMPHTAVDRGSIPKARSMADQTPRAEAERCSIAALRGRLGQTQLLHQHLEPWLAAQVVPAGIDLDEADTDVVRRLGAF